ncbi:polyphosphate glucokinase [Rubritalea halochordaticola]|uniref:Polyphosphate glucokinase n=1 Tax=Rubritalea halochordaticola TaxID=714537 RepID=A0ABP9V3Z3_9BACT
MAANSQKNTKRQILVIDVGGSNIKMIATGQAERIKIPSEPDMTPEQMIKLVQEATAEWDYDHVALGIPCVVLHGEPATNPVNLGKGWIGFDFEKAFGVPTKVINDAAMQAYGCYHGGTMLFLGLGTGLGTTLICDGTIIPLEAGHLPYRKKKSFEQYVGKKGFNKLGAEKWEKHVRKVIKILRDAFNAEDIVIGGGNAKLLDPMPKGTRRTDNGAAFTGGFRLWGEEHA